MTGSVNAELEPLLRLTVQEAGGRPQDVEAVVDTGYNGYLTLPPALILTLGLTWIGRQQSQLADGSILTVDVHVATVIWHGVPWDVEVEVADTEPLVGMEMLRDAELSIKVVPGGPVTVTPLP